MREFRAAVVGCGRIGAATPDDVRAQLPPGWWPLNHLDAVLATPGLRLVGVCDRDAVAAARAAARSGGAPAYADHADLLRDTRPDLVTVATRTEGRCDIIRDAVAAGARAIHAEKPLCRSLADGRAAADAVARAGVAFTWGATRRHMAAYRTARALIAERGLGAVRQVVLGFGCAPLLWTHPHTVDIASFFLDDAEIVAARALFAEPVAPVGEVLDADPRIALAHLAFAGGGSALVTLAQGCDVVVACEDGEVAVRDDGALVELRRRSGAYFADREVLRPAPAESGLQAALGRLRDALAGGPPAAVGFDAGRAVGLQRALLAMALSGVRGGAEVACADVPDGFTVTGRIGGRFA